MQLMKNQKKLSPTPLSLRQKAEEKLKRTDPMSIFPLSKAEMMKIVHEINVFQEEVLIQNEELKDAAARAEAAAEKLRSFVTCAPIGIYMADVKGKCTFVNDSWCKMSGLVPEEAYGDGWIKGIHPKDREALSERWNNFIEKGTGWECEYRFFNRKREITWVYGIAMPARDLKGNITGIIGWNIDINNHKLIEIKVHENEEKYRLLFDNSLFAVMLTIPDGRILSANPAACRMFGMTEKELCRAGRDAIMDLSDIRLDEALRERYATGCFTGELTGVRKDGTRFPLLVSSGMFNDSEGNVRNSVIISDIAKSKLSEESLIKSEENLRSLIENTDSSIWSIDLEYRLIDGNTHFKNSFEKGTGRILNKGDNVLEGLPSLVETDWIEYYNRGFSGERFSIITSTVAPLQKAFLKYSINPIRNSDGTVTGLTVIGQNITDMIVAEERLRISSDELRELSKHLLEVREEERTRIARDLHDDLGQKLTALNMDIAWIKSRMGVQSRAVENKVKQMGELLNSTIQSIQKISYGLRPSILDDLGLLPALESQVNEFSKTSGISCVISDLIPDIVIEKHISLVIFRVVQEALTNIARHSGATKVKIKISLINNILEFIVKDNGSGIEQEKIDSNKSFGLIGMRERVRIVGGEVLITGKQGEGTMVCVRIPVETGNRQ